MIFRAVFLAVVGCVLSACAGRYSPPEEGASAAVPLMIGDTFTIDSMALHEERRINVFVPTVYGQKVDAPLPVLYMPDGGMSEDFLHVAGLVQVLVSDGSMRPFMVVGIENTQRRRDMTGPTDNPEDRKIAPVVGGSAMYRRFISEELMPTIRARYRTTEETAIVGESLAGLFVVETFLLHPDLFDTYIAIDPSVWWNNEEFVNPANTRFADRLVRPKAVFLASSNEPELARLTAKLADVLEARRAPMGGLKLHYVPLTAESHATIYHPAAMVGFRSVMGAGAK